MSGLFSIGTSALLANQRALSTTGHNIANATTEGFSRQRVDFVARQVPGSNIGSGVDSTTIERFSDAFANQRLIGSTSQHAALESSSDLARRLDLVLSDPSTGLADPLRQFIDSVDAWAADPAATETRVQMLGQAESLASRFDQLQTGLDNLGAEINLRISDAVSQVNQLSDSIARLNDEISLSTNSASGQRPNDLLDERDRLVTELAGLIDVSTLEQDDGSVNVFAGQGIALVVGGSAQTLDAVAGPNPSVTTSVQLSGADISAQFKGGELGGLLGFRGDVMDPAQAQLTDLAVELSNTVNTLQAAGTDLNGQPGQDLFAVNPPSARLEVLISDPDELAAAAGGAAAGSGDNTNALAIAAALRNPLGGGASAQERNISMVGGVGSAARRLAAEESAQLTLLNNHQNLRDEVSGVNLDEEAANLLRFQQAYQAAAQVIAIANETFETLLAATR